jgi:flagellar biosynthesis protein FlhG
MAKILTVTSGKGGVGKTNISVNLAVLLARKGYRTCLFDADLGLANINILLGVYPEYNLEDVIDGKKELKEIVIHDKNGIDIIPGSSGVAKMESLSSKQLTNLAQAFGQMDEYDYLIFDTSAGISKNVIAFCMNASEVVLVITPEPTSLTDGYALMKVLSLNGFKQTARVVVNQSKNPKMAQLAFTKLKDTVQKFLGIQLVPLGTLASDSKVVEAVTNQKPFITLFPNTLAAKGLEAVTTKLLQPSDDDGDRTFTLDGFWSRCIDILTSPLKLPVRKSDAPERKEAAPSTPPAPVTEQPKAAVTPSAPPSSTVPGTTAPSQGLETTNRLLEQLVEKLSAVTTELAGIKSTLAQGVRIGNPSGSAAGKGESAAPVIPLDFESFLAQQNSGTKKPDVS